MAASVSIVVVSFETRARTLACVRSILDLGDEAVIEVLVVDNASTDQTAEHMRAEFPDLRVIALAANIGFAAACNLGARHSTGDFVLLVNPDTEMRAGCVRALLDASERHPRAGIVGGRTVDETNNLDPHSCWALPSLWSLVCFATGLSTVFPRSRLFDPESLGRWPRDTEREVGVVTGCLLLCSRRLWDELGGMDETYFVYGEDVDFSFRARQLGYRPMITPAAELMHVRGAASSSSAGKWAMILRGKVTFMRRRWSPGRARLGLILLLTGTALRAAATNLKLPVAGPWQENWRNRREWIQGWEVVPRVDVTIRNDSAA